MDSKPMHSNRITIRELLQLTDLSERELLDLLSRGVIPFHPGENGELLLDITGLAPEALVSEHSTSFNEMPEAERAELEEVVGSELATALDSIASEAIELAAKWLANSNKENE